jgi:DNA-binding CsgD family transcriptional regulator
MMTPKERLIISSVLVLIIIMVLADLLTDARDGIHWWHLLAEGSTALAAMFGVFWLMRDAMRLKSTLMAQTIQSEALNAQAQTWRAQASKYISGLSVQIETQLNDWGLTQSEKDVAFLLLKGLSSKDIASMRQTSEKTVRAHATALYEKAGLKGRSELSAFFLEDLLAPNHEG